MTKTIKVILIISAIIIPVAVLGVVFWPKQDQPSNTNQPSVNEPIANNPEPTATTTEVEIITTDIDTSDWQTYRNEEWGFEVKYPRELELITKTHDQIIFHRDCSEFKDDFIPSMRCQVAGDFVISLYSKTLDEFIKDYEDDFIEIGPLTRIVYQEDYILDDVPCIKLTGTTAEGAGGLDYIFVTYNNRNYLISYNQYIDDYMGILSTFKFIK